jgi:putative component of membrane protein insertase Oxa1/YidC/SpoIIIJ protein YidD
MDFRSFADKVAPKQQFVGDSTTNNLSRATRCRSARGGLADPVPATEKRQSQSEEHKHARRFLL